MNYPELVRLHGASSHWRLGETSGLTAVDRLGGKNGTISGGVTLNQAGGINDPDKSMLFDGTTGKIATSWSLSISADFTVEGWINVPNSPNQYSFFNNYATGSSGQIYVGINGNRQFLFLAGPNLGFIGTTLALNIWLHLVYVYKDPYMYFYINGILKNTFDATRPVAPVAGLVNLGFAQTTSEYWKSLLDEVAYYPRALGGGEVMSHYQAGITGVFTPQVVPLISPGPVTPMSQDLVYALPASACNVRGGPILQKSSLYEGPFSNWEKSDLGVYHPGGGFTKCNSGNTTIQATRVKMKDVGSGNDYSYSNQVILDGATNYWRLEEASGLQAKDVVGNAHGVISGGLTLNQVGIAGRMMSSNGSGQITCPTITLGNVFSIEFWMKQRDIPAVNSLILGVFGTVGVAFQLQTGAELNNLWFYLGSSFAKGINVLKVNEWAHVVGTANGTTLRLYVNGILVHSFAGSGVPTPSAFLIFSAQGAGLNGWLDEVAIYAGKVLTPAQILSHYQNGFPKYAVGTNYSSVVFADKPSYYWRLNEPVGTTVVADQVGGAHGNATGSYTLGELGISPDDDGIRLDGATAKVTTTANVVLPAVCSVEFWLKTPFNTPGQAFLSFRVGTNNLIIFTGTAGVIRAYDTGLNNTSTKAPTDDYWHHVVCVFAATGNQYYIDGVIDPVIGTPYTRPQSSSVLNMGWDAQLAQFYNGFLDEVAIYPYALSPSQILSHFLARPQIPYTQQILVDRPSNFWRFNEGTGTGGGTTAFDSAGSAHATIAGNLLRGNYGATGDGDLNFNGTDTKATTGIPVRMVPPFTFECWAKFYNAANYPVLASNRFVGGGLFDAFTFYRNPSGQIVLECRYNTVGGAKPTLVATTLAAFTTFVWYHIVYVVQSKTARIYVNGVNYSHAATEPFNVPIAGSSSYPFIIGNNTDADFMNGDLDDPVIYQYALTPEQIVSHYRIRIEGP
jgi:hypothetical protein